MKIQVVIIAILGIFSLVSGATLEITNGTGEWDFNYVYVSLSSSSSWGNNQLEEDEYLLPGDSVEFEIQDGTYDLKIIDEDGDSYTRWSVAIEDTYEWIVTLDYLDNRCGPSG